MIFAIALADMIGEGVTLLIGVFMYVHGHQLSNPKKDESTEEAAKRERTGRLLRICGPLVVLGSVLKLTAKAIAERQ